MCACLSPILSNRSSEALECLIQPEGLVQCVQTGKLRNQESTSAGPENTGRQDDMTDMMDLS